jgi:hypothetical protein
MAALDSPYTDPSDTFVWWIEGDRIAIATSKGDADTTETGEGKLKPVQLGSGNTVTGGLIISYNAEPDKVATIAGSINIDNSLQPLLVDYIKGHALLDAAAKQTEPNMAQIKVGLAQAFLATFKEGLRRYAMKKNDKTGGTRAVVPPNLI